MAVIFDYKTSRPLTNTQGIPLIIEAGDYMFINGRPYDKATLVPVPEGVALIPLYSARANITPVCTNTRYYSRYLGDGTAPAYRCPLPPSVTPLRSAVDVGGVKWIGYPDELLSLVSEMAKEDGALPSQGNIGPARKFPLSWVPFVHQRWKPKL